MHEEERGWRGFAVRAGLLHPTAPRHSLFSTHHVSLAPPRLPSFGISPPEQQQDSSKWRRSLSLFSEVSHLDSGVQLSGTHSIGLGTVFEALIQGSKVQLAELRLRMSKTLLSSSKSEKRRPCETATLALCLASDLQHRSRVTVESMIGTKEDGHTVSCALTSDFQSQLALGVASSHRLGKTWTFFTRYSKDDYAGERFILQAVHELNAWNRLSAVYAATVGHNPQAGFSWIHEACKEGEAKKSLSLRGLCSGDGNFSVSIKAEVGVTE